MHQVKPSSQYPWIQSPAVDSLLILAPPFLAVIAVLLFRDGMDNTTDIPLWAWVSFILCVDVAHVYSTTFRTYFNRAEFDENRTLFTLVPLFSWLAGVLLYSIDPLIFWRVLAYTAVFHFIRQQYGFMMLYSRNENQQRRRWKWVDTSLIYLAAIYPIVFWHTHLPRNFHWFVDGDFIASLPQWVESVTLCMYLVAICLYVAKELFDATKYRQTCIPKHLIIIGTALSWYIGIVALNGDMAFTITNVIAHGVPYIGLIWIYGRKHSKKAQDQPIFRRVMFRHVFALSCIPLFVGTLLCLAYFEEGLWSGLIWRERMMFFKGFSVLPAITDHATLAWVVPLLSLPQVTHYVLDGFIWKLRDRGAGWQSTVFSEGRAP